MKSYTYHLLMSAAFGTLLTAQVSAQMVIVNVGINQPAALVADAGANQSVCNNQAIVLGGSPAASGGTGLISYSWSPPMGLSSTTVPNPTLNATNAAAYTLTVIDQNNCTSTDVVQVSVGSAAVAGFTYSGNGLQVAFSNTSAAATTYLWDFGNGLTSTFPNPSHTYATPGIYTVCLIANGSGGCADTLCQVVDLSVAIDPSLLTRAELYPNPFSGSANLAFTLQHAAEVKVEAYDMSGKRIAHLLESELPAGDHTLPIRTGERGLPNGVYLIKLTVNGETMTLRAMAQN
jgi:hypothetical protein